MIIFFVVLMMILALAMKTSANEEAIDEALVPAVLEPFMNERIFTPEGIEETWTFFASKDTFCLRPIQLQTMDCGRL